MSKNREKEIFLDALEIESPQERDSFLEKACGADEQLLQKVKELLYAHYKNSNSAEQLLDSKGSLKDHLQQAASALGLSVSDFGSAEEQGLDRTGQFIHHFRLMEKLGEGGFGQVYVAQQNQPVKREVAIKLLKPGMDTGDVLARFEAEQQALALMNHPNIAHVYEVGATESGQPYIVMELVRGIPITTFCRKKRLPLEDRIDLFHEVCLAVHHAHQKGVIHRDIKPSNVLVAMHDTQPVTKVIDFGVAKAINNPLTDKTIYTRFAQLIGTPMYMSPEQAELNAIDLDTRSDIYSLGVLLYELLTDSTPISQDRLQSATFDEMREMIRDEEPQRPSLRISTRSSESTITTESGQVANSTELSGRLRGDLDWIVMKALEKNRHRRYDSAADFAKDINCFRNNEPVGARPPSQWYRLTKLAQRNKLALVTGTLILATLIVATIISSWQAIRANSARAEAEEARTDALEFAQRLRDANILLVGARANADQGRIEQAYDDYSRAMELSPDHFLTYARRGSLLVRVGAFDAAADDYERAVELGGTASDPSWWGVPQLLFYTDRDSSYRVICNELSHSIDQVNDEGQLMMLIRASCMKPVSKEKAILYLKQLERLTRGPDGENPRRFGDRSARPSPGRGFHRGPSRKMPRELVDYTLALVHYRLGNDQETQRLLEPIVRHRQYRMEGVIQMAPAILAMVYQRQGDHDSAREMLQLAIRKDQIWTQQIGESQPRFPWFDGLEGHILLNEAARLITGKRPEGDDLGDIEDAVLLQLNR